MDVDTDYEALVREDVRSAAASPDAGPDVPALLANGRRRLRRRRSVAAAGVAAAVLTVAAVPALASSLGSGDATERPQEPPVAGGDGDDAPPIDPVVLRGCGWFSCADDGVRDRRPALGEVVPFATTPAGTPEVVWASERVLFDPTSNSETTGPVIMTGFADGGTRLDGAFALQPEHSFFPDCTMEAYSATLARGGWAFVAALPGEATDVRLDGEREPALVSTEVLDGYTVVVAHGERAAGKPETVTAVVAGTPVELPFAGCTSTG
jgi:hypothetical protein